MRATVYETTFCVIVLFALPSSNQGVGLFANDNPALNNSAVLADSSNQIGTIYCTSGLHDSTNGQWFAPDGTQISAGITSSLTVVYGGGNFPSSAGLRLNSGYSVTASEEGVYTCIILDEDGIQQTLYVGIYRYGFSTVPSVSVMSMSHPLLTINCVTSGTPALVTWNYQNEDLIYQNDEGHQITHSLLDGTTATYNSAIAFTFIPVNETGVHRCDAETTYISSDTGGTSTAAERRFFGLYAVGEVLSVYCNDLSGTATLLQWLDDSGNIVASSNGGSVLIQITPVTDVHNGQVYRCRLYSGAVLQDDLAFPIISFFPVSAPIIVVIQLPSTNAPVAGSSFSLSCLAVDSGIGISSTPLIELTGPDGNPVSNGEGITVGALVNGDTVVTQTIAYDSIRISHSGLYTCTATLDSPTLTIPYVTTSSRAVIVSAPAPILVITQTDGPHYVGSSLTITCTIVLQPAVDTGVKLIATWTGPDGTILSNSSRVTISDAILISSQTYRTAVIVIGLESSVDAGSYTCNAALTPELSYVTGSSASTDTNVVVQDFALQVDVLPTSLSILDAEPYNRFTLTCTVTVPASVQVAKMIEWSRSFQGSSSPLSHNGDTVIITNSDLSTAITTSILVTRENVAGNVSYICTSTVSGIIGSDSAKIQVQGPIPPEQPTGLGFDDSTYISAVLEWTIPYVSYTPENYQVRYGLTEANLDQASQIVDGGTDLVSTNQVFSVGLTGLLPDTTYYWKVVANNSFTTTESSIGTFVTVPLPLVVSIGTNGSTVAGETFKLTCQAMEEANITDTPELEWIIPDDTSGIGVSVGDSETTGRTTTLMLQFSPLSVYHEGQYTCQAYLSSIDLWRMVSHNVTVSTQTIAVQITSIPSGPDHHAATSLSISCGTAAANVYEPAMYEWTSTCTGDCFLLGSTNATVTRSVLHSTDSGSHTCLVTDAVGNTGAATIDVNVFGVGIHYEGIGLISNNSFVTANSSATVQHLQCSSGSSVADVGSWIAPSGQDITTSSTDPFDVIVGGDSNPGYLSVLQASGHFLSASFQGIYTCILPDENGVERQLNVGVYPNGFNAPPTITSLERTAEISSVFTLSCVSTQSPATTVTWTRDGVSLSSDSTYRMAQILVDRAAATYDNQLSIDTGPYGTTGNYSCSVSNSLGSDSANIAINGLQIAVSNILFIVGETASLTCSSDLDISSIEWLYSGQLVANSTGQQQLELVFSPVNDTIHDREYTCRVTSPYGTQEDAHIVISEVPADRVVVNISAEGNPFAGQQYRLTCIVTYPAGIANPIEVKWRDASGLITSGEGISVGDVMIDGTMITTTLEFSPLRVAHEGLVKCEATVRTTALPFSLVQIAELDINVQVVAELLITISSNPESGTYLAGSSVALTCNVNGGHLPLMYEWNSTCDRDCFIDSQTTASVVQDILHSVDTGNHTCLATDFVGHTGSASIEMVITGASLYLEGTGLLHNNSLILATSTGRIDQVQCVGGSTTPNVGAWIAPNGVDITFKNDDAFDIVVGDANDPGYLSVQLPTGVSLSETDWGVYTCIIPDEAENLQYLHLGIYPQDFTTSPSITSLQVLESSTSLTLECISTGSPATTVVWSRDGTGLQTNDFEYTNQILRNGTTASYSTVVTLAGVLCTLSGTYGCTVHDSLGQNSMTAIVEIEAISITGNHGTLSVGDTITITCSTDLDAIAVQWYYNSNMIVNSPGSLADLVFNPVNDSIHNREYVCTVLTSSCSIDQATTVTVQVPDRAITVSVVSTALPVAGNNYTIICSVSLTNGLSGVPEVMWLDSDGQEIVSEGDTTVYGPLTSGLITTLILEFDPLRIRDEGPYTCYAVYSSPITSSEINSSATEYIDVELVQPLLVSIVDTANLTQDFLYTPGSSVMLNCVVQGAIEPIIYEWNSTCKSDCFVLSQQSSSVVEKEIIHSIDSGNHSCMVLDDVGNSGASTIEMQVVGVSFYSFDPENSGLFPNNGIIVTDNFGQTDRIQCISGSQMPDVGQWITPDGQDVTQSSNDQFDIIVGGVNDPGYLDITLASGRSLTHGDQGVYTCLIPDETGTTQQLHVGLYLPGFAVAVGIVSLQESINFSSAFVINCTSDGSPPTNVTWYKNEEVLEGSDTYQMVQILTNAATATFDNILVVYTEPATVVGTYSCFIENGVSPSTQERITFEGVQIIDNTTLIVGKTATIICYIDLQVEKLEWFYSEDLVVNSNSQQADLHFDTVYNYYHNREYTCRATTSYGILEKNVILSVQIPPSALNVSVTTVGSSVAGESYKLVCTASVIEGIEATPQSLQWLDTDGQQIQSDSDISVGTARLENGAVILPLQFGVLRVSHTGEYTCQATVFLPGFDPIVSMTSSYVNVETVELDVTIVSTVSGPVLNVAQLLTLTCQATGGTEEYIYQWSSTCTGSCFISDQMSQSVTRDALRSSDSGNHTCVVLDNAGNSGTASVTISVIGVGLHSIGALGQVSNNSILFANGDGRIPQLQCLSGSTVPSVGRWLSPDGSDLLNITGDPFEITVGSDSDPGSVVIETPAVNIPLSQSDEGVYTCIIPDEVEEVHYLHIGIYQNGFNTNPTVSSLQRVTNSTTLNCISTGSPATTVMWTKDGVTLNNNARYQISQILTDGTTSTYSNLLYIFLDPDDITGLYSCRVLNQIGFSSSETYLIQGLQITGNDAVLPVGESASLTCSSDLDVSSIEWLYSGQVVARSTSRQELELELNPVNDTIHGREYTCRVTSPYGSQERSAVTTVAILDPMALRVSTSAAGNRTAGNPYTINCLATKLEGLLATPVIIWQGPDGNSINNGEDIMVYPLIAEGNVTISQIEITTLQTSDGGQYTCAVSLNSPALETPLTATAVAAITVQIPTPTVTVFTASDAPLLAGSRLILNCSAEEIQEIDTNISINFTWRRSGESLSSDGRIIVSMATQVGPTVYQSELLFNTLSQTTDPGEYTCEVTIVSGPPSVYIDSATGFDRVNLAIQSPLLEVLVAPTSVIVLDIAPYNTFILTCTATQPSSVTLNKTIEWRESRNGVTQTIVEDGNGANITTTGLHDPTTTSLLSVKVDTAAESILSCVASLQVPKDQLISQSSNAPVTVIGPTAPVQPVDLVHTAVASDFVIVQWVVPHIAYTPETYIIQYGTDENFLTNASDVVSGSSDITVANQLYSVRLSNLEPLTDYFYQVVAMNSFRSNASEMATFTTSSPVLTASVRTEGNSTAGDILTLICSVEVSEETPGVPTIEWRRVFNNSRIISEESITVGNPLTIGQITTAMLEFSPIKTSHGGQYTCRGNISSPLEGLQTVFVTEDIIVQIPSPIVNISSLPDTSLYTGTTLILTCTIELNDTVDTPVVLTGTWRRSGDVITNTSHARFSEVIQNSALVYQTSLSLIPLSSTLDSGQYECESLVRPDSGSEFVVMGRGSDTLSASIEALPGPSIVISSEGTPTAGEVYTLTCTFSVIDGLVDSAIILSYWSDSNGNTITAEDTLLLAPTVTGTTTMLPLQFSQLRTSHAGQYFCRASISIQEISAQQNSSLGQTVVVQIPEPTVAVLSIQDDNLLSGTYLSINCSIDLNPAVDTQVTVTNSWLRNGMDISDNSRLMVSQSSSEAESHHYEAYIEFSTLSSAVDSGTYICTVTATPTTMQEYITSGFGSASYMITVADPIISVEVTPLSYTGLDTEPYNAFSLTCMATKPTEVIPNISLTWFHNGTQLDTSALGVSISEDESSNGAMKSSQLAVDADDFSDSGSYSCHASLTIPESGTVESSQASIITIIGPTLPAAPMPLDNITTTASSAVFSWLVGSNTYTPESYTVVYGLSADTLNNTTDAVQGTTDVTATDLVYSTTIDGLAAFRQYYYRIIATNSYRSTQSSINTLCTMMSAPTASPELFQAVSIRARSASLYWELPLESGRNGIVISYSVACTDAESNPIISDEVTETSFTVEELQPYSQYNCTVAASTSVGEGPPAKLTFNTIEDAPEDAPTNVTVVDVSSSSVLVTWTPPSLPNGIIIHYTLYVDYADGSAIIEVNTLSFYSNYTIDDLQPYQLVRVQVSASTAAGEGPLSNPAMGRAGVEGASLYLQGTGLLQNNSLVLATSTGRIEQVQCVSGSTTPNVGAWIAPNGVDITFKNDDAFDVVVGDASDPGYLSVQLPTGVSLSETDWGVYTCIIPDEADNLQYLHLGIYPQDFTTFPSITSLQIVDSSTSLTLECISTGSPATAVVWSRDGTGLQTDAIEYTNQILKNGIIASYSTVVSLAGVLCTLSGTYGCTVHDSLGQNSMTATVDVEVISITGNHDTLSVGGTTTITCSTDLDAIAVQWYYNSSMIVNSPGSLADLVFSPVNDSIHNREYVCTVVTSSCFIDQATTVTVQVPDRAISVSVVSTALPVAGNNYTVTCSVTLINGLSGFPEVMWLNSDGQEILTEGDTAVYGPLTTGLITTLVLEFDPLRIRDEGLYTCYAVYSSPITSSKINSSATKYIDVELEQPLLVSVVDIANLTQDFLYTPGSSVMLNCVVQGAIEPVIYEWNSTCRSDCFVLSQLSSSFVEKEIIHSIDSGNHTCMVLDDVGNSGVSTIEMQVVGASFYSFDPENSGLFPNNGIIVTDNFGQTDRMQCISGSQTPDVGRWITPDGQDVTWSSNDQFDIIVGGVNDPGYLDITLASGRSLTHGDQGVYTCLIPDETGATRELHVGLYLPEFTVAVGIASLQESTTFSSAFVINCTSDGSPPTNVTWYKNEEVLEGSDTYQMVQILTNAATAIFDNLLVVYTDPVTVLGTYSCFIENSISPSTRENITFEGVQIIDNTTLIVGQTGTIVCSTDLHVEKLEWFYSEDLVANSNSQYVDLHFDTVYNYHHNREYTCRATTSYGILEKIIILSVEIPPSALNVSITTVGNSVAGESYELVCTASVIEGIEATPQSLQWLDTDGQQIQSNSDISVGTARLENGAVILPLQFGVLRVSHTGEYTCQATVFLPGFDPIVSMTSSYVDVETIELDVTIVSAVSGRVLNVAESLTLTCQATGGTEEYSYQWSSTCTGSCFITDQMSRSVTRDALRSSDSGNHTCVVLDNAGNSGTASVTISVTGVGLYSAGSVGQTPNNSILIANNDGRIPQLQCLSGSTVPSVGRWLSPDGSDLLNITGDPFEITVGSDNNSGSVVIETPALNLPLSQSDEGVYTCIIPDEVEEVHYMHIGIYLNGFSTNPTILLLERVTNSTTLNCTSTGSPATTVIWTKDGVTLNNDAGYQISQILTDGTTSTYSNLLYVFLDPDDLTGVYTCRIMNQIGFSSSETYLIQGLRITGNDAVLPVGQSASLTCSSDLDVSSIEWLYSGQVVARSTSQQELELELNPVNDTIHGREYTCRVTSPYGSQERSVVTTVAILDPTALRVSTNAVGNRTAGNPYTINCLATKLEGLSATPEIMWLDPHGNSINNGEDIMLHLLLTYENVTISQIEISTLKTSDGGQYTCAVSLDSPALETPLTATAVTAVTVEIPAPTVTVSTASDAPLLAGSRLILECSANVIPEVDTDISINFTWKRSGESLSSDGRITVSMATQARPAVYQNELLFNTLSQTTDPGEYICEVTMVSSPPSVYIDSATGFDRVNIAVLPPILEVVVAPTSVIVLDIAPYSMFILTCAATQPSSVTLNKTIEWKESRNGVTQAIVEDGNTVNITTTGLHNSTTTSLLSVKANTAAESILSCVASLQVPKDQLLSQSSNAQVTVKGPTAPVQPIDLVNTAVASDFVIVQWVVPYNAYTPETYVVQHGTTEKFLTNTSDVITGSSDITVTNQLYSVRLSNLEPLTDYFYQVVAMNSFSTNASEMATFTTSSPVLTASVRTERNSTAGDILTLICSVEVSEETPGVPTIEWRRVFNNSRVISEESITVGNPLTIGQITTVTLEFSPIKTSHGGQYTCRANISSPLEGLQTVFVTEDVIVQIPSPIVNISGLPDTSLYTGTTLILTCTIQLHETIDTPVVLTGTWRRSGDLIANTSRAHISEVIQNSVLVYQTSLSLIPLSSTLDSGQYECESLVRPDSGSEFVIMGRGSDTLSASIDALPGPIIVISSEGIPTAGEVYTLTCTFSVIDGLVDSAIILSYWSDSNGNTITAEDTLLLAPTVTGTTTMLPLQFSQLHTSHAGQYFCRASISIPEISAQQNSSLGQTVVVQIPEPAVAVLSTQGDNLLSGTYLQINCSIDLNPAVDTQVAITNLWLRNGMDISDNSRVMVSEPSEMESHHYEAYIEFSTLSSAVDSGTYICTVTATPSTLQEYITSGFGSASYTITVVDPVISVEVTPLSYTGLDTEPYNAFILTCMATKPSEVIPNISLTWFHNNTQLDTSVLGVSISEDESINGAMKSSQLSVDADDSSDSGSYSCQASLTLLESSTVESSQASIITIIGPTLPAAPMPLDNITTTASSAVVSWLVGSITYTPESYTVVYGLSADTLNNTTDAVQGTIDVTATDLVYSATIDGLAAFRQYYYKIIATNSFRSTQSSTNTFLTMMSAPTAPPELFQAVSISARSASLYWELPIESGRNGIIISYSVACSDAESNPIISDEVTETSSTVEGLQPYSQYNCTVAASTSVGEGPPAKLTFDTIEDAPEDAPTNVTVVDVSSSSVLVTWTAPSLPNGIIIHYTLYVDYADGSAIVEVNTLTFYTNYTIDDLQPYQLVRVQVSASTAAGEGPLSNPALGRANEEAPSGPPLDFTISPAGPGTFQFSWSPPAEPDRNGIINSYNLTCQPDIEGLPVIFSDAGTYTLDEFVIATHYNCSLSASTSAGDGPAAMQEETAPEYPPSSPPLNFTIMAAGATALEFSWSPPAEEDRNGFITGYTLSCQPPSEQLPADFSDAGEQTLDGFIPGTEYICSIAASTSVGIGPQTSAMGSTEDDIPGEVTALNVTAVADTTLYVSWSEPLITNGIILFYSVIVETVTATVDNTSVNSLDVTINVLSPFVPYTVSVSASTSAGSGQSIQMIMFTREGAPSISPKNVATVRLNGTHMNVTWDRLTPAEARGFLTGYTITYDILEKQQRKKRQILTEEVGPNESYKVIGNLELTASYEVTVSASTTGGKGVVSEEITTESPPSSIFQLRLTGIPKCTTWRFDDTDNKIFQLKSAIVVNLQQYCDCSVTLTHVTSAELSCPGETEVIFRARIYSAPDANNTVLISSLQQWIASGPSIVIQSNRLDLDTECDIEIESFSDPNCPKATPKKGISLGIIAGAAVGGIGVIIAVILALYIFRKIRRRRNYNISGHSLNTSPIEVYSTIDSIRSTNPYACPMTNRGPLPPLFKTDSGADVKMNPGAEYCDVKDTDSSSGIYEQIDPRPWDEEEPDVENPMYDDIIIANLRR